MSTDKRGYFYQPAEWCLQSRLHHPQRRARHKDEVNNSLFRRCYHWGVLEHVRARVCLTQFG